MKLSHRDKIRIGSMLISTSFKFAYGLVWQEETFSSLTDKVNNKLGHFLGRIILRVINPLLSLSTNFPVYDRDLQVRSIFCTYLKIIKKLSFITQRGVNIFPGEDRCNRMNPHSRWHVQSAIALLDMVYTTDEICKITEPRPKECRLKGILAKIFCRG